MARKLSIPMIFILSFLAFFAIIFGLQRWMFGGLQIPPEATFGKPIPADAQILSSLKAVDGTTLSFYNPANQHKVSIARSKAPNGEAPSGEPLVDTIIKYQAEAALDPRLAPLSLRFLSAEIDGRRARDIVVVKTASGQSLTNFATHRGATYSITAIRKGGEEILVVVYRKDNPIDAGYAEQLVDSLTTG